MEEYNESIKSEVVEDHDTLRIGRKSSVIHEEGVASHKSQSEIGVDSELKESGGNINLVDSPIKEVRVVQASDDYDQVRESVTTLNQAAQHAKTKQKQSKHDEPITETYRVGRDSQESHNGGDLVKNQKRESRPSSHFKSNIAVTVDGQDLSHHITDGGFQQVVQSSIRGGDIEDHNALDSKLLDTSNKPSGLGLDYNHTGDITNSRDRYYSEFDKSQAGQTPKDNVSKRQNTSAAQAIGQKSVLPKSNTTTKRSDAPIPSRQGYHTKNKMSYPDHLEEVTSLQQVSEDVQERNSSPPMNKNQHHHIQQLQDKNPPGTAEFPSRTPTSAGKAAKQLKKVKVYKHVRHTTTEQYNSVAPAVEIYMASSYNSGQMLHGIEEANYQDNKIAMIEQRMRNKKKTYNQSQKRMAVDNQQMQQQFSQSQKNFYSKSQHFDDAINRPQQYEDQEMADQLNNAQFQTELNHPSTVTLGFDAPKPPRRRGQKRKQQVIAERNQKIQDAYMRYKISPSMNRNVRLQSLGNEHAFRSTGLITNEAGTTNYTTTNASHGQQSPKTFFRRASHDLRQNSSSPKYTSGSASNVMFNGGYTAQLRQNEASGVPEIVTDAPYVNKIGPGQHTFINTFDVNRNYYVNKYQNSPCFSFSKLSKVDFRFNNSPTRQEYTSIQAFRDRVDKNYDQMRKTGPPLLGSFDTEYTRNGGEINQFASQMINKAFNQFGNQKGSKSPSRMTKTQTFSKEERGAVHLLYDPDFREKNDFRHDLRKVANSPGPGAHQDPLTSFKNVAHSNGNFSIPKAKRMDLKVRKVWDSPAPDSYQPDTAHKKMMQRQANKHMFPQARRHIDTRLCKFKISNHHHLDAFECTSILEKGCAMHI